MAQPTFDAKTLLNNGAVGQWQNATHTGHVCAATANGLIFLIGTRAASGANVTSIAWDPSGTNQAATFIARLNGTQFTVEVWWLPNPTTGTKQWTVNKAATVFCVAHCISLIGIDTTTPFTGASATNQGTGDPASVNMNGSTGNLVLSLAAFLGALTPVISGGTNRTSMDATVAKDTPAKLQNNGVATKTSYEDGAATVGSNWTGSSGGAWAEIGVSVPGAVAAATGKSQSIKT